MKTASQKINSDTSRPVSGNRFKEDTTTRYEKNRNIVKINPRRNILHPYDEFDNIVDTTIRNIYQESLFRYSMFENLALNYYNEYKKIRCPGYILERSKSEMLLRLDKEYEYTIERINSEIHNLIYTFWMYANTTAAYMKSNETTGNFTKSKSRTRFVKLDFEQFSENITAMGNNARKYAVKKGEIYFFPRDIDSFSKFISPSKSDSAENINYRDLKKMLDLISKILKTWYSDTRKEYEENLHKLNAAEKEILDYGFSEVHEELLLDGLKCYRLNLSKSIYSCIPESADMPVSCERKVTPKKNIYKKLLRDCMYN